MRQPKAQTEMRDTRIVCFGLASGLMYVLQLCETVFARLVVLETMNKQNNL